MLILAGNVSSRREHSRKKGANNFSLATRECCLGVILPGNRVEQARIRNLSAQTPFQTILLRATASFCNVRLINSQT